MKWACVVFLMACPLVTLGQEKEPVRLKEVKVFENRLFDKETAGLKQTRVDSIVLKENLNHTLSELLSENTPIFIKAYGRGSMATASFRGTAPSHTQVLWNGMSINSPMLGMVDFSLLPVYFIDQVELKHGGASVEDISGALGGSISMNNKPDWHNTFSGKMVVGAGSFGTHEAFGQVNAGNGQFQSKTRLYHTYSRNDFPFINDAVIGKPRQRNENADYRMYSVMQEFYGRLSSKDILSVKAWFHSADRSIPKLNSDESDEHANINLQRDETWRINTSWDHNYRGGTISLDAGVNVQRLDYTLQNYIRIGFIPAIYSESQATSYINKLQVVHDLSPSATFKLAVNINHHRVNTADSVAKTGYGERRNEMLWFAGIYKNVNDRLNLRAVLRQDYADNELVPAIPSAGFDLKLSGNRELYLKGNIIRNYRIPTLNDLYWQPGGNPDLRPEQGVTGEMSLAWKKRGEKLWIASQLTGFHSNIRDWIIWIPSFKGFWEPRNVKKVIARGIELSAKVKSGIGPVRLSLNVNYAFTRSLNYGETNTWGDESYGKQLVYIPVHSGNVFANLHYKGYTFTVQHNSFSRRFTTSSNDLTARDDLPNYYMNHVYLSKVLKWKKFTFEPQLKVYNLFNEYYRSVLDRRMPSRNYMILLMARF